MVHPQDTARFLRHRRAGESRCQSPISTANPKPVSVEIPRRQASRSLTGVNRLILLALIVPSATLGAEPRAIATFESIGVYWTPPADPGAGGCPIQFRKSGESAWREGLPLWFDARNAECRGH